MKYYISDSNKLVILKILKILKILIQTDYKINPGKYTIFLSFF